MLEINIFYSLLLGHLLSDFVFQTNKSVYDRLSNNKEIYIKANLKHCIIHFITTLILISLYSKHINIIKALIILIALIIIHFIIDIVKSYISKNYRFKKIRFEIFFIDQALHLLFILMATILIVYKQNIFNDNIIKQIIMPAQKYLGLDEKLLIGSNLLVIALWGGGIFIKLFLEHLNYKHDKDVQNENYFKDISSFNKRGTVNGGFYIGLLERMFIIASISLNMPEVIGFTLATKSIARFKDFDKDKFVEEFIIGSFISFIFAIIIGYLIKKLSIF